MAKLISRKDFLKGTAAGILTLTAGPILGSIASAEETAIYTPGTYTASEQGLESTVTVTMTFDKTSITAVSIDASGETEGIGAATPDPLARAILDAQSAEIDGVSGATVTSNAVKKPQQTASPRQKEKSPPDQKEKQHRLNLPRTTGWVRNRSSMTRMSMAKRRRMSSSLALVSPVSLPPEALPRLARQSLESTVLLPRTAVPANMPFSTAQS